MGSQFDIPPKKDKPRALITGITGFTGAYLARELSESGYEVVGLSHEPDGSAYQSAIVDLCDREKLQETIQATAPDVVAHLAAIAFVAHGDVDAIYRTNVVGTRNLLEALSQLNQTPQSVLLVSSANIYGNATIETISEDTTPAPANDYAVSKLAMEYAAKLWMDRLPITIVRPFNYTGVGQSPQFLVPKIVSHFRSGASEIELGNLDVARDFSDVRRVAVAYQQLIEKRVSGEIFNVCSGRAHSLEEVIAMMETIAGRKIQVKVNPAFVRENEVKKLVGDCSKLEQKIGKLPEIPFEDTLRWMYADGGPQ